MIDENKLSYERLSDTIEICISKEHRFGTDAFLLADFSSPRHKDAVCDYCSGCGIIALLMIRNFSPAYVSAVELQKDAVKLLEMSKKRSDLKIDIFGCDLKNFRSPRPLDLITCNPPYKISDTGILSNGEAAAIARHEIMCSIDDVCKSAAKNLKFGGRLCICNRPERLCDVMAAMRANGIEPKRLRTVQKRPDTPPWLILVEGKKGSKPFMKIEPPLFTDDGHGGFSPEMKRIYRIENTGTFERKDQNEASCN